MLNIQRGLLGLFSLMGCAGAQAPRELVEARSAYLRASSGAASRLTVIDLHAARDHLDQAEQSFLSAPDSDETRHLAYIALRSSQTADAHGDTLQSEQEGIQSEQQRAQQTSQRLAQVEADLERTRRAQVETEQALATERQTRVDAEQHAQIALATLRQAATAQEAQQGMVITLSGEVLFMTGRATLLPRAQQRLEQVVQALRDQSTRQLRVEGYTDSRGGPAANLALSRARAISVRNYLVSQGIESQRIEAVGNGSRAPVAGNGTPEDRAYNRRVEVMVAAAPVITLRLGSP